MKQNKDETIGKKFNRLTVLSVFYKNNGTRERPYCKCLCDCGNERVIEYYSVISGHTKSCGCASHEIHYKHGGFGTRLYHTWANMIYRCRAFNSKIGKDYACRGIRVCDEWLAFEPFRDWAIQNGYADDLSIDRIDNNGNYEPNNCRWVPIEEQQSNRRSVKMLTYNGKTQCVSAWANEYGISPSALHARLRRNTTSESVLRRAQAESGEL